MTTITPEGAAAALRRDTWGRAHVLGLSGGKDSTALALLMAERCPEVPLNYVCTPTGDELPEMLDHWADLEQRIGAPLLRVQHEDAEGRVTLNRLIEGFNALPNFRMRWCTRLLKIEPTIALIARAAPALLYVGLRADEEAREGIFGKTPSRFPLREWGLGEADVWRVLEDRGVRIPRRTDCARCYHQRIVEWKALWELHPSVYADAVAQEKRIGATFRSPGRDTWPVDLERLAEAFAAGRAIRGEEAYWTRVQRGEGGCRVCSL